MNCRCAGIDGGLAPVQKILSGYSQVECALDPFLDKAAFHKVPDAPTVPYKKGAGQVVFLVSMNAGIIAATPGYEKIKQMKSLVRLMPEPYQVGDELRHSVDLFSSAGCVILASKDKAQVEADIAAIRAMEKDGSLFKLEVELGSRDIGRTRAESFDVKMEGACKKGRTSRGRSESLRARAESSEPKSEQKKDTWLFPRGVLVGAFLGFALARANK